MFVVTVTFTIKTGHSSEFLEAVLAQAQNSLEREADCTRFDVCAAPDDPCVIFLYEIYASAEAFKAHLESPHFLDFDAKTKDWLVGKSVDTWHRL